MAHVVAPLERDLLDLLLGDEAGALGAVGLDARGFGLHRDRFGQVTDLEHDRPQPQPLGGGEHDAGLHGGLEAVEGDGHLVGAGEQVGHHEGAVVVVVRLACVPVFLMVTVAPGRTLPEESTTVPVI